MTVQWQVITSALRSAFDNDTMSAGGDMAAMNQKCCKAGIGPPQPESI
jgi:AICAR transformylase/IMP cyclohydrolase PurH